ncbi:hypothetical protein LY02_01343 [Nonlabens ulvanivorans]|uniref:Uncharacterized protein n=1 Tax=Nonlabens ulvanivorans TaxID=906888 RepID=A0A081DAI1_NONUL|nr:hypothetical protein LY02_01343 [Nonlabens ulvanivorans]GAK75927.1 hypothetical protein JCM19296_1524 [Nonlabens ulvanivorans]
MFYWGLFGFGGIFFFIWLSNKNRKLRLQKRKSYRNNLKARFKDNREGREMK